MNLSPDTRIAGVLAPLFALKGKNDLGVGDVAALKDLADWCAAVGFRVIQILPINETGADNSPYNAISSVALDPTTIQTDPDGIPDLIEADYTEVLAGFPLTEMGAGSVNYQQVKLLKHSLLLKAFGRFSVANDAKRTKQFEVFCKQQAAWLADYTLFRALMEQHGNELWDTWPENQQTATKARTWLHSESPKVRDSFANTRRYYAYVQWIAYSQWTDLKSYCDKRQVALMGDIPIGVSYYSADVFSRQDIFDLTWSCGAPPERVFKSEPFVEKWGQNWGVPLYRWAAMRETNYDWWRQRVRMIREVFHLFRIDHVLGFYRIFSFPWRPQRNEEFLPLSEEEARARCDGALPRFIPNDDASWENREANRLHGEELLHMVLDVVGEHCLIGEDLGVVPDYVRPSMASLGVAGFKVPMWETTPDGQLVPGASYDRLSIASYATHDHPPMKAFWNEWVDIIKRAEAGETEAIEQVDDVRHQMHALANFAEIELGMNPQEYDDSIREGLLRGLFACNSWLAVPMISDVFGDTQRFNVPGAVADSNWSNRIETPVVAWQSEPKLAAKAEGITRILHETGR